MYSNKHITAIDCSYTHKPSNIIYEIFNIKAKVRRFVDHISFDSIPPIRLGYHCWDRLERSLCGSSRGERQLQRGATMPKSHPKTRDALFSQWVYPILRESHKHKTSNSVSQHSFCYLVSFKRSPSIQMPTKSVVVQEISIPPCRSSPSAKNWRLIQPSAGFSDQLS
jgi:hypothetical protein